MDGSTTVDWQRLEERVASLEERSSAGNASTREGVSLVVFSGDLDRVLASLNIATASAATGTPTSVFFTFWGITALLDRGRAPGKSIVERCFGRLLPRGARKLKLSRLDMGGVGRKLMLSELRRKGAPGVEQLMSMCAELGVTFRVCEQSMTIMGIRSEELRDYPNLEICGAATFVESATSSASSLFI